MWFKDKNSFVGKRYNLAADSGELMRLSGIFARVLAERAESRDGGRAAHVERVSQLTGILARAMLAEGYPDFSAEYADNIITASVLHDVGKLAVSDAVLAKKGKLSSAEAEELMRHTVEGGRLLDSVAEKIGEGTYIPIAAAIARYHHERWNGCGYPDRLGGEDIPLPARMVALADGFDCFVESGRSPDEAAEAVEAFGGVYYDPRLTEIFLRRLAAIKKLYNESEQ